MTKKLNPNEAPPGYVAMPGNDSCYGCAFWIDSSRCSVQYTIACIEPSRKDGHGVIFIKREPAPLDTRYTLRLPTSVKSKAQRIGAAKVIAAIEAAQE